MKVLQKYAEYAKYVCRIQEKGNCTGCVQVKFRSTSKWDNVCRVYITGKTLIHLRSPIYALLIFLNSFWYCNFIYAFGGKFQILFVDPSRANLEKCWFSAKLVLKKFKYLIRRETKPNTLQNVTLSILFERSNHATFHFFDILVKNTPNLPFISYCVKGNFSFVPKSIERYHFLI